MIVRIFQITLLLKNQLNQSMKITFFLLTFYEEGTYVGLIWEKTNSNVSRDGKTMSTTGHTMYALRKILHPSTFLFFAHPMNSENNIWHDTPNDTNNIAQRVQNEISIKCFIIAEFCNIYNEFMSIGSSYVSIGKKCSCSC